MLLSFMPRCLFLVSCLSLLAYQGYSQTASERLPQWAAVMYQEMKREAPDFARVIRLYETYYQQHPFQKNSHTWQYKMWLRDPASYIPNKPLYHQQQEQIRRSYVQRRQAASSRARAGTAWSPIGPIQNHNSNGDIISSITYVASIASAPSDSTILFCGTEAGEVYKSTNGGQSWNCISLDHQLVMSLWNGVTAIGVHPTNPDVVYVAGENNFYKSLDGGINWTQLVGASGKAYRMIIHPTHPDTVLWATTTGLYRSTDGGMTISQLMTSHCYDLDIHPTHPDSMYVIRRNNTTIHPEFYSTYDGGATWQLKTNGWYHSSAADRTLNGAAIAISRSNPNIIYALLLGDSTASDEGLIGIYKSMDGGDSWTIPVGHCGDPYTTTHINYSPWSKAFMCEFMVSPTDPNALIVGTASCYKSTDGGLSFTGIGGYTGFSTFGIHADVRDIYQDAHYTWITTDGGISRSSDFFTNNADKLTYGLHGQDFWGFDIGWHEDVLIGGLYHNGVVARYQTYPDRFFLSVAGGEPATGYVNPSNGRLTYYYNDASILPDQLGQGGAQRVFRRPIKPYEMHWPAYSSRLAFHPNCYETFYQGSDNKFWKTTDGGQSFSLIKDFYTPTADSSLNVAQIEISSSTPDIIYLTRAKFVGSASAFPQLWKTTDGGATWTQLTLPTTNGDTRVLITIDPTDANNIWIGYANGLAYMTSIQSSMDGSKVFQSTDGGINWRNITSPILDGETCHDLIHVAGTNGGVYFCSQNTVYYKENTMSNWVQENNNLPFYINTNIGKIWYKEGKIRLGTYGRGVWENDLHTPMGAPVARIMVNQLKQDVSSYCGISNMDSFYFDDHSFLRYSDSATGTWLWSFPTGSPSSSTQRNPAVLFNGIGTHQAILTVTSLDGQTDSDTLWMDIRQEPLPTTLQEGFETGLPSTFQIHNYDTANTWQIVQGGGFNTSSQSIMMNNYPYNRPGEYDEFRFFFDNTQPSLLHFDVAYAPYSANLGDTLEVLVSTDCGQTLQSVYFKEPFTLATVPIGTPYPNATSWRTDSIDLSAYSGTSELLIVFRNINNYGNKLYIDNINIHPQQVVSVQTLAPPTQFTVFPNPVKAGSQLQHTSNCSEPFTFRLLNTKGQQLSYQTIHQQPIVLPEGLPSGVYFYLAEYPTRRFQGKIMVQ